MSTEERTITIVDDIMGSGKSTWAINYINDNPDRKFLCIVPLVIILQCLVIRLDIFCIFRHTAIL